MSDPTKTFICDKLARNVNRIPIGRVILHDDKEYVEGQPLKVSVMKLLDKYVSNPIGYELYIDCCKYKIPELQKVKFHKSGSEWWISNFILPRG